MLRFFYVLLFTAFCMTISYSQAIQPGNLVVLRVGDGTTSLTNASARVSLLEINLSSNTVLNQINFPFSGVGAKLTQSGTSTNEGNLSISNDGNYIVAVGYNADEGISAITGTDASGVIGIVDVNDISNLNLDFNFSRLASSAYRQNSFRGAITTDGSEIWGSGTGTGSTGGIRFLDNTNNGTAGILLNNMRTNTRVIRTFGGDIYFTSAAGTIEKVNDGMVRTSAATISSLSGIISGNSSPNGFVFFDRDENVSGYDLLYLAIDNGNVTAGGYERGLHKFYKNSLGNWIHAGTLKGSSALPNPPGFFHSSDVTGFINCNGEVELYLSIMATTTPSSSRPSKVFKFIDYSNYDQNISNNGANLFDVLSSPIIDVSSSNYYRLGNVVIASYPKVVAYSSESINIPAGNYGDIYLKSGSYASLTGNINVTGTITIEDGATFDLGSFEIGTALTPVNLASNFILEKGATLRIAHSEGISATGSIGGVQTCIRKFSSEATYEYYGNESQNTGTGLPTLIGSNGKLIINKSTNDDLVILSQPTQVNGVVEFNLGKIISDEINILVFGQNSLYSGASINSFVHGPVKKIGNTDFSFPIGKYGVYAPLSIEGAGGSSTDAFTAEYFLVNPQSVPYLTHGLETGVIDHISGVEYWSLARDASTASTKKVELTVHEDSYCKAIANTFIAFHDANTWMQKPSTVLTSTSIPPDWEIGTIISDDEFTATEFGYHSNTLYLTLATDLSIAANPLPISLVKFNAVKKGFNEAYIDWQMAREQQIYTSVVLEKSTNQKDFVAVKNEPLNAAQDYYYHFDYEIQNATTYYRLKLIRSDGTYSYSQLVAIVGDKDGILITTVYPNPVNNKISMQLSVVDRGKVYFTLYTISGVLVDKWTTVIQSNAQQIERDFSHLARGTYLLQVTNEKGSKTATKIIKQ